LSNELDESHSLQQREVPRDPLGGDDDPARKLPLVDRLTVAGRSEPAQHHIDQASLGAQPVVVQHAVGDECAAAGIVQVSNVDGDVCSQPLSILGAV